MRPRGFRDKKKITSQVWLHQNGKVKDLERKGMYSRGKNEEKKEENRTYKLIKCRMKGEICLEVVQKWKK
jgi:hypothetical protein